MSASRLEDLQKRFVRSVTFVPDPAFVDAVTGGGKLSAAEAVQVYRSGYPARLTEALGETYRVCWRVLGDEDFFAACRDFAARAPSTSYNLSDYGEHFGEFLMTRPDAEHAPFLGELAKLEWAFKLVFHSAPHAGLDPAVLAAKASPDAVLVFGGATRLLKLRSRVYAIWKRDLDDDTPIEPADAEGEQALFLYKSGDNAVYSRELDADEAAALGALIDGRRLEDALAAAPGLTPEKTRALFAFLAESVAVAEVR